MRGGNNGGEIERDRRLDNVVSNSRSRVGFTSAVRGSRSSGSSGGKISKSNLEKFIAKGGEAGNSRAARGSRSSGGSGGKISKSNLEKFIAKGGKAGNSRAARGSRSSGGSGGKISKSNLEKFIAKGAKAGAGRAARGSRSSGGSGGKISKSNLEKFIAKGGRASRVSRSSGGSGGKLSKSKLEKFIEGRGVVGAGRVVHRQSVTRRSTIRKSNLKNNNKVLRNSSVHSSRGSVAIEGVVSTKQRKKSTHIVFNDQAISVVPEHVVERGRGGSEVMKRSPTVLGGGTSGIGGGTSGIGGGTSGYSREGETAGYVEGTCGGTGHTGGLGRFISRGLNRANITGKSITDAYRYGGLIPAIKGISTGLGGQTKPSRPDDSIQVVQRTPSRKPGVLFDQQEVNDLCKRKRSTIKPTSEEICELVVGDMIIWFL